MTDIAHLRYDIDSSPAQDAANDLDRMTAASKKAEQAALSMSGSSQRAASAVQQMAGSAKAAANHFDTIYDAVNHNFATQYAAQMGVVTAANGKAAASSKVLTQSTLNLSRQFADIGVTAAMGMSPLLILIQQGPQIADALAMAKAEGVGLRDVFGSMAKAINPVTIALGAVAAGAVAGFALFEREIDKNTKHATTWGDTWNATVKVVGDAIMNGPIGEGLRWLSAAFGATLDAIVDGVTWWVDKVVGHFGAAYELVVKNWRRLPEVFGVIIQGAANITINAVEGMINKVIQGVNVLLKAAGKEAIGLIDLPEIRVANAKLTAEYEANAKRIEGAFRASREGIADRIAAQADKEFLARQKATKATKDHERALKDHSKAANDNADAMERAAEQSLAFADSLAKQIFEFGKSAIWLLEWEIAAQAAAAPTQELADRIRELGDQLVGLKKGEQAVQDLNKAMGEFIAMPRPDFGAGGGLADQFEEAMRAADEVRYAVDDIYYSIRNNDWVGAFAGLFRVLEQLKTALTTNASLATKIGAVAGVGQAVGGMVGGKAGGFISGASSGAATGAMLGSVIPGVGTAIGAIAGGIIGGIGGWFGSSKAEKAAKNAEALRRAEEELARVREIAAARFDLEVQLMEAQGNTAGALAKRREAELRAMDASLRPLQELVWAEQKLAEERQKAVDTAQQAVDDARARLSEAYDAEAGALENYIDKFRTWSESLSKFLGALYRGPAAMLSPEEQYRSARAEFDRVSGLAASGDENAIRDLESVSQAYLDASKDYYASSKEYFADLERVRSAVSATQTYAAQQVDVGQAQLTALNASVAGILNVNSSVLSVRDALAGYQAAIQALAAAQAAQQQAANDNTAGGTPKAADWGSYISRNSDVANEYLRNQNSAKGRAYLESLGIANVTDFGRWHYENFGKNEGRTPFATGGSFTVGGYGGTDSQDFGPIALTPGEVVNVRRPGDMAKEGAAVEAKLDRLIAATEGLRVELQAANRQRGAAAVETNKKLDALTDETAKVAKTIRAAA